MNCFQCKQLLEFVCLDCSEEICSTCDKRQKHLIHEKQKIQCITNKCNSIKVQIDDEKKFNEIKENLNQNVESAIKVLENLSEIQQKFQKMVQDAEYHCEIKRLSKKFTESIGKKETAPFQKETLIKIISKSKKCGFNLGDSYQESSLTINQIQEQLSNQQKLSKQLENEIKKLQDKIEGNKLLSIQDSNQTGTEYDRTAYQKRESNNNIQQEIQQATSINTRSTRKRKVDNQDLVSPISKQNVREDLSTLKLNKMENATQLCKDSSSPLLIKKLKKNLQQLY
ncbi:hypothetical protein TTHERM_01129760 (macronuclear) [Tetrahymena thermophila SB210]|uniref:B box-type domain-containing protein n=1 Tax=Tetrahymena thermophila (strain SB210) TaxID=312017 RepID=Q24F49_TETTS|nr:hypothetical protein TTHERM_01129760 [Tetrahymena thermophila SB210]EAS06426.1 hypothetical protein TTHERM_01129760 [Tetrahymena thermophila SB210]|eukprot:XP_001026671.1 hypothetical protein TTHERM_01129760 [Tetrahymena thermophila SB210]